MCRARRTGCGRTSGFPPRPSSCAEVRLAVEKAVRPHAAEIGQREETAESFPWQAFRGLDDEGVFAIPFGPEFGQSLQYPLLGTCTATEEIACHSRSMAGVYDGQCILVPKALSFGSKDLQATLIPGLVTGELVFAFATTEPDASSDLSVGAMQTVAEVTADGFVVTGGSAGSPTVRWPSGSRCCVAAGGACRCWPLT